MSAACPSAVLAARVTRRPQVTSPAVLYQRILVATDGSKTATKAVDRAAELAATANARLSILSVGPDDKAQKVVDQEQERLAATHPTLDIDTRIGDGDPADVIVDTADSGDFDLLVVGNKGMKGISRFLTGSVPNDVSHHATCALLIVRTT